MEHSFNPWVLGNILAGGSGLFSTTTDHANGSAIKYDEDSYLVTLEPLNNNSTTYPIKRKVKQIIVNFNHDLRLELVYGHGQNIDALLELLEIPELERESNINTLAKLSIGNPDGIAFANTVVEFY